VVGASLAGLRVVEGLRQGGYDGRLVVVGEEPHLPYDRPPLSKQVLAGEWGEDRIALRDASRYEQLDVDWRLGRRAVGLDLVSRTVELDDASALSFDALAITTGARPRTLPGLAARPGVHTLRTIEDSLALSATLERPGARVVVVGAGFIGSEVAATCRGRGAEVTLVEALPTPLGQVLGEEMGKVCAALHADHGVGLRLGVGVAAVEGESEVTGVRLADGSRLEADVVVIGVGVVPNTEWLEGSGLRLADGVVCDSACFAAPGVVAAGDVARWHHPRLGIDLRVEHWTNAAEQGAVAAHSLLAGPSGAEAYAPVPYFWSDQYEVKIQYVGHARPDDEVRVVHGSTGERRFVAVYGREGRLTAALAIDRPRQLMAYRNLLAAGASWEEALAVEGA
jgi:NADPH-dependent 2,4-dienoyl-CoA reductase/sulfur reductase-like enzyme